MDIDKTVKQRMQVRFVDLRIIIRINKEERLLIFSRTRRSMRVFERWKSSNKIRWDDFERFEKNFHCYVVPSHDSHEITRATWIRGLHLSCVETLRRRNETTILCPFTCAGRQPVISARCTQQSSIHSVNLINEL